jgi:hypothetical protein
VLGVCSTCGGGRSREATQKLAAQMRFFSMPCPILSCAVERRIDYCPRDCREFPCDRFRESAYPFSEGFLAMQERRRAQAWRQTPSGEQITVPQEYWKELEQADASRVCEHALAKLHAPSGFILSFLNVKLWVDTESRRVHCRRRGIWERMDHPMLELISLVYLLGAKPATLAGRMVGAAELKCSHFFAGPHTLRTQPLLNRYGGDLEGFREAAERVGGAALDHADASYELTVFPRIPLYYLFWAGDEEFPPRLSILFDASIEKHLGGDAIWGLVYLVSDELLFPWIGGS